MSWLRRWMGDRLRPAGTRAGPSGAPPVAVPSRTTSARSQPPPDPEPLLPFLPTLCDPAFRHGEWRGGETRDGVMAVPFFAYTAEADAVVLAAARGNWVRPEIRWSTWAAEPCYERLRSDPDALRGASASEVAHLLTTLIRGDRFNEGLLASAFADGTVRRILERIAALSALDAGVEATPGGAPSRRLEFRNGRQ